MKKHFFTLIFLVLSITAQTQKVEYLVKPTLELDAVSPFSEGMAMIAKKDKYGFINNKGKKIINPEYDFAYDFYNGLAVIRRNGSYFFIDKFGEIGIEHQNISKNIEYGLKWVSTYGSRIGVIDTSAKKIKFWQSDGSIIEELMKPEPPVENNNVDINLPPKLISDFEAVKQNGKWGFLNSEGNLSITCQYDSVKLFHEGFVAVSLKKQSENSLLKWSFIDSTGKIISDFLFDKVFDFHNGMACVIIKNKKGFINKTGKIIIPTIYDLQTDDRFSNGFVEVSLNSKYATFDSEGKIVIPFKFDKINRNLSSANYLKPIPKLFAWVMLNNKWGGVDKVGKIFIPLIYDAPGYQEFQGIIRLMRNTKIGFADFKGKEITSFVFERNDYFHNGLIGILRNSKWAITDKTGKEIIPSSTYEDFTIFSERVILAKKNQQYKILLRSGENIEEYDSEHDFIDGGIWISKNNKWGCLNYNGEFLLPISQDTRGLYHKDIGLIQFKRNDKIGFIDSLGKTIIPFIYDKCDMTKNGLLILIKDGKWGVLDKTGKIVLNLIYDRIELYPENIILGVINKENNYFTLEGTKIIGFFNYASCFVSEGLIAVRSNGLSGFINKDLEVVIPYNYSGVHNFSEGLSLVIKDELKYNLDGSSTRNNVRGFINKTGKEIIPLQNEDKDSFSDGFARVFRDGKYCSFIDTTGKIALSLSYDYALSFSEGLAWVKQNNKWGCVDKTGKIVIPIQFDDADENSFYFSEGLAWVKLNGKWGIIKNPLAKK